MFESAWISPPLLNVGAATFTQGFPTVQFNSAAIAGIAAWQLANPYALITQQQFRGGSVAGISGIYNILAYNQLTGVATLDRIYADPSGVATSYSIYQLYYAAPMLDFLTWISVTNMIMNIDLDLNTTREELDRIDPQRSAYEFPTCVVPWGADQRGAGTINQSATYGYPLFELWGQAVSPFTYQCYGIRRGVDMMNPTDTLPPAIGDDLVMARARYRAYEWAEANKDMSPRSSGPDFKFLMGAAEKEYGKLLTQYRRQDHEFMNNNFSSRRTRAAWNNWASYNTIAGYSSTGGGLSGGW